MTVTCVCMLHYVCIIELHLPQTLFNCDAFILTVFANSNMYEIKWGC